MLAYNQLSVASGFYFYAAYLKTKLQTGSQFKKASSLVTANTVVRVEVFGQQIHNLDSDNSP